MLATGFFYFARALFAYALWRTAVGAWRHKEQHRFDVVLFLGAVAVLPLIPQGSLSGAAVRDALRALLPLFAILVVRHLRPVPASYPVFGWLVPSAVFLAGLVWGIQTLAITRWAVPAYLSVGMVLAAAAMIVEARRARGVHAKRMAFVAFGTCGLTLQLAAATVLSFSTIDNRLAAAAPLRTVGNLALLSFFLAFSTPRWLTARWRRTEQAAYLAQVSEREPEERGWLAAEDLVDGVERCVGGALVFVARPHPHGGDELFIRASSDRSLLGTKVTASTGLLGVVTTTQTAVIGSPEQCEPDVAHWLMAYGASVLVAPIVANSRSWGLVVAVHRRGALFPEDDLSMLAQLARNAATAFDHAALIVERREQARRVSDARLRELESRVGLMLDSIKDYAMLVLDEHGIVAAWHIGAQHVFGHTREQIAEESGASLFDVTSTVFAGWLAEADECGVAEREGQCRRLDGSTFTGVTTIRPLMAEPGAPPGFVVITRDVTERRGLEDRLRQGEKMQAIGQLAGGVAHDFNNLLTAILGYADWLERDLGSDPRAEQIKEIQRAAERAADLTRQLLAFSRRQVVRRTSLDLPRLVRELLPMLRRLIDSRITIADATSALTSPVLGDRGQVEQIVLNLVLNARDAMPNGGHITIRAGDVSGGAELAVLRRPGLDIVLEVSDSGMGMSEETRRRAFEPFFTTKAPGVGTGLGLATVYGIVQQMGGQIEVESELGCGTTFRLHLPRTAELVAEADPPESLPMMIGGETLLLIEDDDALRGYLLQVLEGHGYHVIQAEGAEAALTVTDAEVQSIDLVISDVFMPGMTGPEVVAELLQVRPGLPTLYISGEGEGSAGFESARLAPGPLLQKPFSSTDLLAKVRELLSVA